MATVSHRLSTEEMKVSKPKLARIHSWKVPCMFFRRHALTTLKTCSWKAKDIKIDVTELGCESVE